MRRFKPAAIAASVSLAAAAFYCIAFFLIVSMRDSVLSFIMGSSFNGASDCKFIIPADGVISLLFAAVIIFINVRQITGRGGRRADTVITAVLFGVSVLAGRTAAVCQMSFVAKAYGAYDIAVITSLRNAMNTAEDSLMLSVILTICASETEYCLFNGIKQGKTAAKTALGLLAAYIISAAAIILLQYTDCSYWAQGYEKIVIPWNTALMMITSVFAVSAAIMLIRNKGRLSPLLITAIPFGVFGFANRASAALQSILIARTERSEVLAVYSLVSLYCSFASVLFYAAIIILTAACAVHAVVSGHNAVTENQTYNYETENAYE